MDVSALSEGLRSGTAVYVYRLAEALSSLDEETAIHFVYNGMPGEGAELARSLERGRARVTCAWFAWRPLPGPLFLRPYPRALREVALSSDVFHLGEFVYPRLRPGMPIVATVHDVTTRLFPRWHNLPNRILHRRRLRWIGRNATRVLIDAEATRADTARALCMPEGRLDVVPLARGTADVAATGAEISRMRERFLLADARYVLFVGVLEPRKNLVRLLEAFSRLPAELYDTKLVLAGNWGWRGSELRRTLAKPELAGRVVVTGPISDDVRRALYADATVFAYPSLYEGFGLPVLEAMAAGLPVVTSRGGTLQEIAGDAAVLVDAADVAGMAAALESLLRDRSMRDRFRRLGLERERLYTWRRTAELTVESYRRAIREAW